MAKNDNATLVIGSGNYLIADTGTALPADLTAPGVDWENIGHTSLEEILAMASEGGEPTVLGTLQNKSLRTTYSTRTEAFNVILQQWDTGALKLYYGANAITTSDGLIAAAASPTPTEKAFLGIFLDGETVFAIYAPKAEIYRAEDWAIEDTESLAGLPISVTPLNYDTNVWTYAVTPIGDPESSSAA